MNIGVQIPAHSFQTNSPTTRFPQPSQKGRRKTTEREVAEEEAVEGAVEEKKDAVTAEEEEATEEEEAAEEEMAEAQEADSYSEDVSSTSPLPVAQSRSVSSLMPSILTTSPSPAASSSQGQSTTSPVSMTSLLTSTFKETTQSTTPKYPDPRETTTQVSSPFTIRDIMVPTQIPRSTQSKGMDIQRASSQNPASTLTTTPGSTTSATDKTAQVFDESKSASNELSSVGLISSGRIPATEPDQSTNSEHNSPEMIITNRSSSPSETISAEPTTTKTDDIVKHNTQITNEAVHGGTPGPIKDPLAPISPISPKETTASLATTLGEDTSTAIPRTTPPVFKRDPETTASPVPSSGAETSPAGPTPTVTPDIPHLVTSLTTSSGADTSMVIPTVIHSPDVSGTIVSQVTHSGTQMSYSIATLTVSSGASELVTSLDTSSGAETSPAIQTQTVSPDELDTTVSSVTHPTETRTSVSRITPDFSHDESNTTTRSMDTSSGSKASSTIPTATISFDRPGLVISLVPNSETETSTTNPTLTASPVFWVTQSGTEASSAAATVTGSFSEKHIATSRVTHPAESPTVPSTSPSFSHSGSDTTPSTATSPEEEDSSSVPTTMIPLAVPDVPSLVTSSREVTGTSYPTLAVSSSEPETPTALVTHSGAQTSSDIPILTVSPGVSGMVTSLVPSSGTEVPSSGTEASLFPTQTVSPGQTEETRASWVTNPGSEASFAVPSLTALPSEAYATASMVTPLAKSSPEVPRTATEFSHSGSDTMQPTATRPRAEASSAVSASTISPQVPDVVTSLVTTSGTEAILLPVQTIQPATTDSWVTHPRADVSSAIPTVTISPGETDTTESWITHPAETRPTITTTVPYFPHSKSDTTPSTATSPGKEASSAVPTKVISPSVPDMVTSLVTSSRAETSISTPTLTISEGESETAASLVTHTGAQASSTTPSLTVSPDAPKLVTSLLTSSGAESSQFPTQTVSLGQQETTASLVTHPGSETSSAVSVLTVSPGEPNTTISFVTHSAETHSTAPGTSSGFSPGQSDTTPLTTTILRAESSSVVPTTTISSSVPDMVTSQISISETDTRTMKPTLTLFPSEPDTTSLVTHAWVQTISATPIVTVSPGVTEMMTSVATSSGTETSSTPTLTVFPGQPETTASLVTHPGREASSAVPTLSLSPTTPNTTASWVTHTAETSQTVSRTIPDFSHSISDTTPSMATSPGTEASSAVSGVGTSLVTSSRITTNTSTPTLTLSSGESETTASLVTHTGSQASSSISTMTVASGVSGIVTPLINSSEPETRTTFRTLTDYSQEPETATSWATHSGSEASSTIPTLTVLVHEPETTASLVTHSAETSTPVSRTVQDFPQSESSSIYPMTSSPETRVNLSVPTTVILPGVPGVVTSQVTSSGTDTSMVTPTLTLSPGEADVIASTVTHPEAQTSSVVSTLTVSSGEPETTASLVTHSVETNTPVSRTTPDFSHSESDTIPLMSTSYGTEASSAILTTISPGIPHMTISLVTGSGKGTSTNFPTATMSLHEQETTVSLVTHSAETSSTVTLTVPNFSQSGLDTIPSTATSPGAEASSAIPTRTISSGEPDMVTSQVSSSGPPASMTISSMTLVPTEPETTVLLTIHPREEASTKFPASTVFSPLSETTASLSTGPGVEVSTALPTQTLFLGGPKTTTSHLTLPVTEIHRGNIGPTISPSVPGETASLSTHPMIEISTTLPTGTYSPGLSVTTGIWATSPSAETSTSIPTLTVSPSVPGLASAFTTTTSEPSTRISWSSETSPPVTSVRLPDDPRTDTGTTMTSVLSETSITPTVSHSKGSSPTTTQKTSTDEITNVAATVSRSTMAETTRALTTGAGNLFASSITPGMSTLAYESVTSETTEVPLLMLFTVNFTVTNLPYVEDMGCPGSEIFNYTEKTLQRVLKPLLRNTSIGSLYAGCRLTLLRADKDESRTRIDLLCTYHSGPTGLKLDREQLYWELSQLTQGVTKLGFYTLDRNSLYVNGYNHHYWIPTKSTAVTSTFPPGAPTSVTLTLNSTAASTVPVLVPFTFNLTITNLHYTSEMGHPDSLNFNYTEKVLNNLLEPLFKNTSIGSSYSGCRLILLRTEQDGAATRVDAVCTYHPDPMGPGLDREQLYQEVSQMTYGVTRLGPYTLDSDSLYVNGYNYRHRTPTTSLPVTSTLSPGLSTSPTSSSTGGSPTLISFTLNFTITNLRHMKNMAFPGSEIFNTTERILSSLLSPLFQNTSIGPLYSGCRLTLLRPEKNGMATGVDTVCTHRPDPMGLELDREKLYWELNHETHGVTQLGSFTLDKDSLYVNGYTHQASAPTPSTAVTSAVFPGTSVVQSHFSSSTAVIPVLVPFTLNLTITNLEFEEGMQHLGSWKFNTTERILQYLLEPLFKTSSLGSLYSGCRLASLRPEKDETATRVDAICTHRPDSQGLRLDREQLYRELSQLTHGITQLGPYTLDRDSLYVNGFTCQSSALSTSTSETSTVDLGTSGTPSSFPRPTSITPTLVPFTLNFTIMNLQYTPDMKHQGSTKFNTTEGILQRLLRPVFNNTSIGPLYSGCRLITLRPENDGSATGVNMICTQRSKQGSTGLDREWLYWELSQETKGITQLGFFTLDRDSLYVNGYTHRVLTSTPSIAVISTIIPSTSATPVLSSTASGPLLVPFIINFTILNLDYEEDMRHPGSWKFNTTERILQSLLRPLFKKTSIGDLYSDCRLTLLRPKKNGTATGVDAVCTHSPDPRSPGLNREQLYRELSQMTHGVTQLGPYTLDQNSLYVNGYTHQILSTTTPRTTVVATTSTEIPTTFSSPTASGPLLVPFTINFTILNLKYEEDMRHPGSWKFNATERILQNLLTPLFKKTSVGTLYSGCRLTLLRPEKNEAATGVDAVCTHHPDPTGPILDTEQLYEELSQLTHGVTWLGPYTLDQDSLYVNGYTHQILSSTPTTSTETSFSSPTASGLLLVPFTINFTILNLEYEEDMRHPGSWKFNATERLLQSLLRPLFKKTNVGSLYSDCRLTLLRPEKNGAATGVDAVCTHHPNSTGHGFNKEQLYRELSQLTHGITQLGPYILDQDSLYVNGYTHKTLSTTPMTAMVATISAGITPFSSPTVSGSLLVPFTINFTILNLEYEEDMRHPGSWKFNVTERILQNLLTPLFKKTTIGALYSGFRLTLLRPEKDGTTTRVDAVCTHRPDPTGSGLDREHLYRELSQLTHGITWLGPYKLDRDSLYVNGYTHKILSTTPRSSVVTTISTGMPSPFSSPTGSGPLLVPFTINFTILNLDYEEDIRHPGSWKFNATERILQSLLRPLFKKTSIGSLYSNCRLTLLRPEKNGAATGVDAICTHRPNPTGPGLDREQLYRELSQLTHGVTQLGPYTLDQDSLYINGYTHQILSTTPMTSAVTTISAAMPMPFSTPTAASPVLLPFTLNFTITNVPYVENMQPGSVRFNSTESILQHLLKPLFTNSSIGSLYNECRLTTLRPEKDRTATGVDAVCTYHPDPAGFGLDRERLYWELSHLTHGVTQLGFYILERDSLYVNGYTRPVLPPVPSVAVTSTLSLGTSTAPITATGPLLVPFTLNFTITGLHYKEGMYPPGSWKFNTTEKVLQRLLGPLFKNTSIGPLYSGCRLTLLRPEKDGAATGVGALCTYHPDPSGPGLNKEQLYRELSQLTHDITQLGPYTLDQDSLYVNGYTYKTVATSGTSSLHVSAGYPHPAPSTTPNTSGSTVVSVTLNFTITNLHYTKEMGRPGSFKFNSTERILQRWLWTLLNKTSVGPLYTGCRLASLRLEKGGAATSVDITCTLLSDSMGSGLNREQLYWELSHETHGVTRLGPYTLDRNSLYVNGFSFGVASPTTTTGEVKEELFTVNFTINNLRYSADMGNHGSLKFNITGTLMQHLLSPLFQRSSLGPLYTGCRMTALRSVNNGAQTRVDMVCTYQQAPGSLGLPAKLVFRELSWQTRGITRLGPYSLDKDSLYLNGYNERGPDEPPTTLEPATTILPSPSTPVQPESTTAMRHHLKTLTLNFTISNLPYSADMSSGSAMFNSTMKVLQYLLRPLLQNSSLSPFYLGCRVTSLRPEKDGAATTVDATCTYLHDLVGPGLDIQKLYWELSQLTHGITQLGNYTLDQDSLYVNNSKPPIPLSTEVPTGSSQHFQLNFTITNLPYSQDIAQPGTTQYQQNKRSIEHALNQVFQNSSIKNYFSDCQVLAFRSVLQNNHTGVDSLCNFSPLARRVDRIAIYEEFLRMTQNGTQLQNFTLDRSSVLVDGYSSIRDDAVPKNSDLPFWAIILICLAGLLGLITCLICCFLVIMCRRKEGDYQVQRHLPGYYLPHLDLRKLQ
ncbi:mucin-16 [Castor canadensis]|uniref:Mucin-16 n=1 Tax=Castor canadensis TaxID=51338 RepID=A0AC58KX04_CASCN